MEVKQRSEYQKNYPYLCVYSIHVSPDEISVRACMYVCVRVKKIP